MPDYGYETYLRRYNSWTEWVDKAESGSDPKGSSQTSDDHWAGASFKEAVTLGRTGWREARNKVNAILDPIREHLAEVLDFTFVRELDMVGFEPNIDMYLSGELECMYDDMPVLAPHKGKAMTLIVDSCITGSVPSEEVFKRGAAIIALVETMTLCGFELEVWGDISVESRTDRKRWTALIRLHRAGDPLDMDQLCFSIGHPAQLRRLCFAHMEAETPKIRKQFGFGTHYGSSYGSPCGIHDTAELVDASFTVSWGNRQNQNMVDNPVQWVLDQLEVQGVYTPPEKRDM